MSLKTWKKEFAPRGAKEVSHYKDITILKWCQKKFAGLLPKNLKKHSVKLDKWKCLCEDNTIEQFYINCETCPLCIKYFDAACNHKCTECPLFKSRGLISCDKTTLMERVSPYDNANPQVMIDWLKVAEHFTND